MFVLMEKKYRPAKFKEIHSVEFQPDRQHKNKNQYLDFVLDEISILFLKFIVLY
jgi:hypothetical protein